MSAQFEAPPPGEPWICVRCTGVRGAHYLTCPTLQLGWDETWTPPQVAQLPG